jgi:hypothetical protein
MTQLSCIKLEKYVAHPATIITKHHHIACLESIVRQLLNARRPERIGRGKPLLQEMKIPCQRSPKMLAVRWRDPSDRAPPHQPEAWLTTPTWEARKGGISSTPHFPAPVYPDLSPRQINSRLRARNATHKYLHWMGIWNHRDCDLRRIL